MEPPPIFPMVFWELTLFLFLNGSSFSLFPNLFTKVILPHPGKESLPPEIFFQFHLPKGVDLSLIAFPACA